MIHSSKPTRTGLPTYQPSYTPIVAQPKGPDLLRRLGIHRFVRWKYSRLVFQIPLLVLSLIAVVDGFTGRQLAPRNMATVSVWLHYRGLVVIALAVFGNAFCAACPLMLTRHVSMRLERLLPFKLRYPKFLKNKYLAAIILLFFFFSYEYFDLWASPWLTAWLVVGYFGAALLVDTLFPKGTFCKYLCPLGQFNFMFASASPTQITAVNHDVCRTCTEKPCLHGRHTGTSEQEAENVSQSAFIPLAEVVNPNGNGNFPGCETNLFVPTMQSNMDCTMCFNCLRACPYDNVALTVRSPLWEWTHSPWQQRGKFALMVMAICLTSWGLLNALAMITPFFAFAEWLAETLNTYNEALLLGLLFTLVTVVGLAVTFTTAHFADVLGKGEQPQEQVSLAEAVLRWGYVVVALGFGFWTAHYLFHFLTGALSIIPVFEHFFWYRGANLDPNWRLARMVPNAWLFPITASITGVYGLLAMWVTVKISLRDYGLERGVIAMWPMLIYVLVFTAIGLVLLAQPMEMRGTIFGPVGG
ncbi:MAG: 4Fe-4S ferredoxin [Deinococcota bacterium]